MIKRKKAILVWFEMDRRLELLQPFISLQQDIEFVHLYFRTRDERQINMSPFEIIYWFDYKSPYELLQKHNPDFIVGATEVLLSISLIAAAKEKNITFFGMQHGFTTEDFMSILPKVKRDATINLPLLKKHFNTARFYFSSLKLKNISRLGQYAKLLISFYSKFPEEAINKKRYKWLKPDYYICFSEISCQHYKKLYNLADNEIKFIGIPSFDNIFKEMNLLKPDAAATKYYLLIDTSFIDYHKPVSDEQIQRCYKTIKEYCKQQNATLYIKLHPRNYQNPGLADDDTITFIRNVDMPQLAKLIINAAGCFGFYSTLTMPIAFTIPTVQIKYDEIYEPLLAKEGVTPVLDFYNFTISDIKFYPFNKNDTLKTKFLYASDGKAVERLKQILIN
jgi:hypothetical protein